MREPRGKTRCLDSGFVIETSPLPSRHAPARYPCGSPGGDALQHTSPDLPQFVREAAGAGFRPQVVVTLREPVATVTSAYFRRHQAEGGSYKTTAFHLWLNLGLLDTHLAGLDEYTVVHYEDLVAGANASAAHALADYLVDVRREDLLEALRHGRGRKRAGHASGKASEADVRYVFGPRGCNEWRALIYDRLDARRGHSWIPRRASGRRMSAS